MNRGVDSAVIETDVSIMSISPSSGQRRGVAEPSVQIAGHEPRPPATARGLRCGRRSGACPRDQAGRRVVAALPRFAPRLDDQMTAFDPRVLAPVAGIKLQLVDAPAAAAHVVQSNAMRRARHRNRTRRTRPAGRLQRRRAWRTGRLATHRGCRRQSRAGGRRKRRAASAWTSWWTCGVIDRASYATPMARTPASKHSQTRILPPTSTPRSPG